IVLDAAELRVARGRRTIGGVSRDDVGTASNWEPSNGCAGERFACVASSLGSVRLRPCGRHNLRWADGGQMEV
ncbi:MAG TPA: hypothetical protein VGS80_09865, partial [Ktedonobacterales bacterium]|nr:hypothetical protein [Ktedonobacterales bacterium]